LQRVDVLIAVAVGQGVAGNGGARCGLRRCRWRDWSRRDRRHRLGSGWSSLGRLRWSRCTGDATIAQQKNMERTRGLNRFTQITGIHGLNPSFQDRIKLADTDPAEIPADCGRGALGNLSRNALEAGAAPQLLGDLFEGRPRSPHRLGLIIGVQDDFSDEKLRPPLVLLNFTERFVDIFVIHQQRWRTHSAHHDPLPEGAGANLVHQRLHRDLIGFEQFDQSAARQAVGALQPIQLGLDFLIGNPDPACLGFLKLELLLDQLTQHCRCDLTDVFRRGGLVQRQQHKSAAGEQVIN
jgi:hypothetical protein